MIATPELPPLPAYGMEQLEPVKRKRGGKRRSRLGYVIGAIIILGDGTRCRIAYFGPDGTAYCYPLD